MPIPRGCLPKSELIRDFQSELITQLSSMLRSLKLRSRLLMLFLPLSFSPRIFSFYPPLQGVELRLPLLHWIMVVLVDQQLTFLVPSGQSPIMGRFLGFATTWLFRSDTKEYR
ncbi:hypothetical protein AVEN_107180-1 [Araneus ventricosus]|uniref:Uncharacterized protein n=1 Tax=Araneus ventricosus TaxID=182803 RepID=A0A4Y2FGW0_ARAVE|nr:hypothetical protein AVEN_107180-1 [Araneus ventricosus]